MSALAIEVSDAGLTAVRDDAVVADSPGYALVERGEIRTGREAERMARLKPRQVFSRYWSELSLEPAPGSGVSAAELAHAQLDALWSEVQTGVGRVVLVVPETMSQEQLGLLLGIAEECAMPVEALVELGVAASERPAPGRQLVYLDAGLHRAHAVALAQNGEGVWRERVEQLRSTGLETLRDAWARSLARRFVAETRFDPFHDAETEQWLYTELQNWIAASARGEPVTAALERRGTRYELVLEPTALQAAVDAHFRALVQLVGTLRAPDTGLVLQLSARLAGLPGLAARLAQMEDAVVSPLAPGAAARGALARLDAAARPSGGVALTRRLPFSGPAMELAPAPEPPPPTERRAPAEAPSHLLYAGVARPLDGAGITVGLEFGAGERGLRIEGETAGISRRHCRLQRRDDGIWLEDLSRYGTYVNERRVAGRVRLKPGDRIRIGSPGVELMAIRVVAEDDGA